MEDDNKVVLPCPVCGRKFRVINPNGMVNVINLAVIDCDCGVMLEYVQATGTLEKV